MENGFLTVGEASQYLVIKPSSLYSMVESKEIPHYRFGRLIKFKKSEIDEWIQKHRVECPNIEKEASRIFGTVHRSSMDIDAVVRKGIADARKTRYTSPRKADRVKGLGKEVSHGAL